MSGSCDEDANKVVNVRLDREGRLFTAMCYHIWIAIEAADDREEKEGRDPMTSAEIVSALAAAVADQLDERGIKKDEFLDLL